ncbi:Uncharacterised protein [Mycolicibacterium vanbaalenii]|uniref:Uncharacterized protein n=1 Tax=Mycolicibacterium vanbaalenii TaxID=110539 RepID=A0A5S9RBL2_MYCVN|nr:Uncharacterised protein [Mycolicibacterium vanbaalenii]
MAVHGRDRRPLPARSAEPSVPALLLTAPRPRRETQWPRPWPAMRAPAKASSRRPRRPQRPAGGANPAAEAAPPSRGSSPGGSGLAGRRSVRCTRRQNVKQPSAASAGRSPTTRPPPRCRRAPRATAGAACPPSIAGTPARWPRPGSVRCLRPPSGARSRGDQSATTHVPKPLGSPRARRGRRQRRVRARNHGTVPTARPRVVRWRRRQPYSMR